MTPPLSIVFPPEHAGLRLDQALAATLPQFSRERLKAWILEGRVMVAGAASKPRDRVRGGETVTVHPHLEAATSAAAEDIPLRVVHEDEAVLVVNKPPGLVVHPGAGNPAGTLLNSLLHHVPALRDLPRAGIVHRLDKDTSGLLVIAKTLPAHTSLVRQLARHQVAREYLALVHGGIVAGGSITTAMGRHPRDRQRMAVLPEGKPAITHYRVAERLGPYTLLRVSLETGRTHQIRVHMSHLRHPIVGDATYGGRSRLPKGVEEGIRQAIGGFPRQALHAQRLAFTHPISRQPLACEAPLPDDMTQLMSLLRGVRWP
jgi:23S rRNA pseudouridine1911/1915/1917 synthase